jgi:hypothetical protein
VITDPLPLRVCSRCINWYRENAAPDEKAERQKALCCVKSVRTYGSETCSNWTRQ